MPKVYAKLLYDGEKVEKDVVVEWKKKKIIDVRKGVEKDDFVAEVVTPAFVDAHSHIGMERHGENEEPDVNEKMESIILADALDSIQMDDFSFKVSLASGVLYSCVLPGSGNVIGGKAVVIRNFAENTSSAFIKYAGVKAALGYNPKSTLDWKGTRPSTRMGVVYLLREGLEKARYHLMQIKKKKKAYEEFSPEERFFIDLLKRDEYLRVHVHKSDDIYALLRIVDKWKIRATIEHACSVNNINTFLALKQRRIPVIFGPLDSFAYKDELREESIRNIKLLLESKVEFGFMTDHPVVMQSLLFYTARHFLHHGMSKEEVISLLTWRNAKLLGLEKLGKIKKNYLASFSLWNGDPFYLSSKIERIIAEGNVTETSTIL